MLEVLRLVESGYVLNKGHLEGLDTLSVGQADDLKAESQGIRVWLSRCSVEDGEPFDNKITIERRDDDGDWLICEEYAG